MVTLFSIMGNSRRDNHERDLAGEAWRDGVEPVGSAYRADGFAADRGGAGECRGAWPVSGWVPRRAAVQPGAVFTHGARARNLPAGGVRGRGAARAQFVRVGLWGFRRAHHGRDPEGDSGMVVVGIGSAQRRDHRPGGRAGGCGDRARASGRRRCGVVRARAHSADSGSPVAGACGRRRAAVRAGHGRVELARLRTGDARDYPLESFDLGVTRPTRVGLTPGCSFITLATSCRESTPEMTRVRLRSASRPLSMTRCHEGMMNSMTRIRSPPFWNQTTSSSSSLRAFCMAPIWPAMREPMGTISACAGAGAGTGSLVAERNASLASCLVRSTRAICCDANTEPGRPALADGDLNRVAAGAVHDDRQGHLLAAERLREFNLNLELVVGSGSDGLDRHCNSAHRHLQARLVALHG